MITLLILWFMFMRLDFQMGLTSRKLRHALQLLKDDKARIDALIEQIDASIARMNSALEASQN